MANGPDSWKDLKWIEPESRFLMKSFFRRELDVMTDQARRTINWSVLALDVALLYVLVRIL